MHDFYFNLKNHSGDIRFLMMTGVTKNEMVLPSHLTDLDWSMRHRNLLCDFQSQKERQFFEDRMNGALRRALGVGDTEFLLALHWQARIQLVGANFRTAKRNIDEPVFGKLKG